MILLSIKLSGNVDLAAEIRDTNTVLFRLKWKLDDMTEVIYSHCSLQSFALHAVCSRLVLQIHVVKFCKMTFLVKKLTHFFPLFRSVQGPDCYSNANKQQNGYKQINSCSQEEWTCLTFKRWMADRKRRLQRKWWNCSMTHLIQMKRTKKWSWSLLNFDFKTQKICGSFVTTQWTKEGIWPTVSVEKFSRKDNSGRFFN